MCVEQLYILLFVYVCVCVKSLISSRICSSTKARNSAGVCFLLLFSTLNTDQTTQHDATEQITEKRVRLQIVLCAIE